MRIFEANYTQVPNVVLDSLSLLSGAEFKIISFVCRQTFGYQRAKAKLSLSFMVKGTGLSRQGVVNASEALIERGWLEKIPDGDSFNYSLKVHTSQDLAVKSVDQSNQLTSQLSRPEVVNSVDQASQLSRPEVVNSVDTKKERSLKKDLKETPLKKDPEGVKEKSASPPESEPVTAALPDRSVRLQDSEPQRQVTQETGSAARQKTFTKENIEAPEWFVHEAPWHTSLTDYDESIVQAVAEILHKGESFKLPNGSRNDAAIAKHLRNLEATARQYYGPTALKARADLLGYWQYAQDKQQRRVAAALMPPAALPDQCPPEPPPTPEEAQQRLAEIKALVATAQAKQKKETTRVI